jgi:hypothetical protein
VNPDIRKEKWRADEDRLLATLVADYGNRWADIARQCVFSFPLKDKVMSACAQRVSKLLRSIG